MRKTGEGKIISAIEALTKSMENPFNFLTNDNIMTNDLEVQAEIIKIDQIKAIECLTKSLDPDISKFVIKESVGVWRGKRSINSVIIKNIYRMVREQKESVSYSRF